MIRGDVTPRRRLSSEESRIPVPSSPILRRSGSQRLSNFSPIAEHARNGTTSNRTPPLHRHRSLQCLSTTPVSACLSPDRDDDVDSVQSFGSAASVASSASQCDHVSFARNGTTYSSRQKRFVFHCSPHTDAGEEYLTPTQRANRTIRKLKQLLQDKQTELIDKEREIFRLTKEVVELRLVKAASASISTIDVAAKENHDHRNNENNGSCSLPLQGGSKSIFNDVSTPTTPVSKKEVVNVIDQRISPSTTDGVAPLPAALADVPASLIDSGHFEDLNSSTRDWSHSPHSSPSVSFPAAPCSTPSQIAIIERIKQQHEDELRELNEKHNDELGVLKERHNDKVDSLLQRITEANDRFCELRPKLVEAEDRIKVLEVENEELKRSQQEAEEKHKAIYLEMYNKGHEAAKLESDMHQGNGDAGSNSILSENEKLLKELNLTKKDLENVKDKDYVSSQNLLSAKEAISLWNFVRKANYRRLLETRQSVSQQDPEITLNFLKSAVYYFLTDRENSQRHLSAIESILGFTDNEKMNIEKAYLWR